MHPCYSPMKNGLCWGNKLSQGSHLYDSSDIILCEQCLSITILKKKKEKIVTYSYILMFDGPYISVFAYNGRIRVICHIPTNLDIVYYSYQQFYQLKINTA